MVVTTVFDFSPAPCYNVNDQENKIRKEVRKVKKIAYLTLLLIDMYAAFSTCGTIEAIASVAVMAAAIAVNMFFDKLNKMRKTY